VAHEEGEEAQFASRVIHGCLYGKYEKGVNRVSAARLFEICEVLDVSLASMFERKLKA
jgi:transcriptional regulator with XRE-family HTH domain